MNSVLKALRSSICLLILNLLVANISCRVGPSTTNDGVTPTVINNNYILFPGDSGIQYVESSDQSTDLNSFSLSLWFRPHQTPSTIQRNMKLISVKPNGFGCFLSLQTQLRCLTDNSGGTADLQVSSDRINLKNWYIMIIRSKAGLSQLQLREMSFDVVQNEHQKNLFFPSGSSSNTFSFQQITLGIDDDQRSDGFIGSIRNLKIVNDYLTDLTMKKIQYTYLYPSSNMPLIVQLALQNTNDLINVASRYARIQTVGQQSLSNEVDYTGAFHCWQPTMSDLQNFWDQGGPSSDGLGDVPSAVNFDGVTCIDAKEKLQFTTTNSYAKAEMKPQTDITEYTIEFWLKLTVSSVSTERFLLSILGESKQTFMTLKIERNNFLYCYPSYSNNIKQTVQYLDFSVQNLGWSHVSCIVDQTATLLKGALYTKDTNFAYYSKENSTSSFNFPTYTANTQYFLYLNTDPLTLSKGERGIYYSELRFWKTALTFQQVQEARFHQLDLSLSRSYLQAYYKLLSGSTVTVINGWSTITSEIDIDLEDSSLARTLSTYGDVSWTPQSDIVFCPVGFFKGEGRLSGNEIEQVCYREGIMNYQLIVYKDSINGYKVTPMYSKFRNNFVRQRVNQIYDFKWDIETITGSIINQTLFRNYVSKQATNNELTLPFIETTDIKGKYDIILQMTDKLKQQNIQSTSIRIKLLQCANIFDRATLKSLVYQDFDSQKGVQDVIFSYGYSECSDYKLDQYAMAFSIENNGVSLSSGDHNPIDQSYTLRSLQQTNLPLNEYFYLKIKAVWRNVKDYTDTFEYHLIYGCRFIEKLVLTLTPNYFTVLKGQMLIIDHRVSYANINMIDKDKTYKIQWSCPGDLNLYCQNVTSDQLKINYADVLKANIEFWKPQTITMTAYTNYIQGDGLKYSTKSINIIWLSVNSDARLNIQGSKNYSKNSNITLQVTVPGLREEQIQILWNMTPPINKTKTCMPNSDARKQFVIDPRCMVDGQTYNATAYIKYKQQQQVIWAGSTQLTIPKPPSSGSLTCSPVQSQAFNTTVKCTTANWKMFTGTSLRYQFYIRQNNGDLFSVSPIQSGNELQSILPPTKMVLVKVIDVQENFAFGTFMVNVTLAPNSSQQLLDYSKKRIDIAKFTKELKSIDLLQEMQLLSQILSANQQNQSTSLDQAQGISEILKFQVFNFTSTLTQDQKKSYASGLMQIANSLTTSLKANSASLNVYQNLQQSIDKLIVQDSAILDFVAQDVNQTKLLFNLQSSLLNNIQSYKVATKLRMLQDASQNNSSQAMSEQELKDINNVTNSVRQFLVKYEQYMSIKLGESQEYSINTNYFNLSVKKYSRMSQAPDNVTFGNSSGKGSYAYSFPITTALQPTDRQSLSIISFKENPFVHMELLNQSASSKNALYFAYRDENGKYLDADSVPGLINITFPYQYSPFVFLPNVSVCGYIGINDQHWENQSCSTKFKREKGVIECSCQHMSFYSIIDDYLERPEKIPILQVEFKNWSSIVALTYILVVFIIGFIYSYNKDNQDFRYLHEQEEKQGNEMEFDEQVSLVSLAFKRQVFFMDFSDKYSYWTLSRLYLMLIHPLFQLKYRLDPHIPRFYRFLVLFTRTNICFGLAFFLLREIPNPGLADDPALAFASLFIFIFVTSLLYLPLPTFIYTPFRSHYYLLKQKSTDGTHALDYEQNPNDIGLDFDTAAQDRFYERFTDVDIDANIPIKLLFLINALPIEKIVADNGEKFGYCTGEIELVAEKLLELDEDYLKVVEERKKIADTQKKGSQGAMTTNNELLNEMSVKDVASSNRGSQQLGIRQSFGVTSEKEAKGRSSEPRNVIVEQVDQESEGNLRSSPFKKAQLRPAGFDQNPIDDGIDENENLNDEAVHQEQREQTQPQNIQNKSRQNNGTSRMTFGNPSSQQQQFEGGEKETSSNASRINLTSTNTGTRPIISQVQNNQTEEHGESDNTSIDTNLFLDEKKEMLEETYFFPRFIAGLVALGINVGIYAGVIAIYIKEGYYDYENYDTWVLAFFGSQIIGLCITCPIYLLFIAAIVSKWCRFKKHMLARFFRESLYVYEDFKFVVKSVNTQIS